MNPFRYRRGGLSALTVLAPSLVVLALRRRRPSSS